MTDREPTNAEVMKELKSLRADVAPLIDFLQVLNGFNRFLKWGGMTLFAFVALAWLFFKKI